MSHLTARESQVVRLICDGHSTKEIACRLGIAFKTADCHRQRAMHKWGTGNTALLVRKAIREGGVIA